MADKKIDPISVRFRPQIEAAIESLTEQKKTSRNEIIEMLCELGLELYNLVDKKFGIHYRGLSQN
jgi:hypothetical protein